MREIYIDRGELRRTRNALDSAREELKGALGDLDHPGDDFPQRDLMIEGVRSLVEDAEEIAHRCRNIATAIEDSMSDFELLDVGVGQAAHVAMQLDQVRGPR